MKKYYQISKFNLKQTLTCWFNKLLYYKICFHNSTFPLLFYSTIEIDNVLYVILNFLLGGSKQFLIEKIDKPS